MGVIYMVAIAIIGGIGATLGGITGFAVGFAQTVDPANHDRTALASMTPFIWGLFGLVGGGFIGLFVGLVGAILSPNVILGTADFVVRLFSRIRRFRKF